MANSEQKPVEERELVENLFLDGVVLKCPMCGNGTWSLVNRPQEDVGPVTKMAGMPVDSLVSSIVIMCLRCGFMSHHNRTFLLERKAEPKDG